MPCASVTWGQLFSLVEKVSINSPAGTLSGSWKLVGTLGLSKSVGTVGLRIAHADERGYLAICAYGGDSNDITPGMSPGRADSIECLMRLWDCT